MLVEKLRCFCQNNLAIFADGNFLSGFIVGLALVLVLLLLFCLVLSRRKRFSSLVVSEEGGLFVLSITTLRTFMRHIVLQFPRTELKSLVIRKKQDGVQLALHLLVFPDTDIIAIRTKLRECILAEAESKFGIGEKIQGIDLKIDKMAEEEEPMDAAAREDSSGKPSPAKSNLAVPPLPPVK